MEQFVQLGDSLPKACRLGFATRGNTHPEPEDLHLALERGVNYWNWCGREDGMSLAIRELGKQRSEVIIATQSGTSDWSRDSQRREVDRLLKTLQIDNIDVLTLYYVESDDEWNRIVGVDGAMKALIEAKEQGLLKKIGLTSHQRPLAAKWLAEGHLDLLMIRYNAAHRGAETEVFPETDKREIPVVCFTCLRWGALLRKTAADPEHFQVPRASEWYRFVLSNPSVGIALMAPDSRAELLENLTLLEHWTSMSNAKRETLIAHGERVKNYAGSFP